MGWNIVLSSLEYTIINYYSKIVESKYRKIGVTYDTYLNNLKNITENTRLKNLKSEVTELVDNIPKLSDKSQEEHLNWIKENESLLKDLWKYGYRLYYVGEVTEEVYKKIAEFVESGIIL